MTSIMFDRDAYFDIVRDSLFGGKLTQQQVEGQEAILGEWELPQSDRSAMTDLRHLAYPLATTLHETASTMWPIVEYGKGSGQPYGVIDPETNQGYWGRGYVQLTWRDNYRKATKELGLKGDADLEWHADMALDPQIAADVMFLGMKEGWFRASSDGKRQTLSRWFNDTVDDAFQAREIINGDKTKVPSWSNGVSIGNLIAGYHKKFLAALEASSVAPVPVPPDAGQVPVTAVVEGYERVVSVVITPDGLVAVDVNGLAWTPSA
jgi:putative chitinase